METPTAASFPRLVFAFRIHYLSALDETVFLDSDLVVEERSLDGREYVVAGSKGSGAAFREKNPPAWWSPVFRGVVE